MTEAARRPLVAGNWKMNGLTEGLGEIGRIRDAVTAGGAGRAEIAICPPATILGAAVEAAGDAIAIGGQDCHAAQSGAHTGDIAAEMLRDLGAAYVILGHSERRADHGEQDADVAAKVSAAICAGLTAILCVGETQAERTGGATLDVVGQQIAGSVPQDCDAASLVVAYEPVWAIGTGLTPQPADVREVHVFIRERLVERFGVAGAQVRILYGGSVKPGNAAELMAIEDVDGALVGGASLKADDLMAIAAVYRD
jgi:triosephosphate isomerase (TIM)